MSDHGRKDKCMLCGLAVSGMPDCQNCPKHARSLAMQNNESDHMQFSYHGYRCREGEVVERATDAVNNSCRARPCSPTNHALDI